MNKFRVSALALVAILIVPFALLLLRPVFAQDRRISADVENVLRERLAVLQEAADLQREAYRSGQTHFSGMLSADHAVLDAQLELAKTGPERIQIREQMLKSADELEKATEALVESGEGPRMDLLSARANRLRAQADLMLEHKTNSP